MVCVKSRSQQRISSQPEVGYWKKFQARLHRHDEGKATLNQQQPLRKSRGILSSPGTWLSGAQLPGLLGFPRGEEQAPGEQVELREEKGAKSESSPFLGLPFRRGLSSPKGVKGTLLHISIRIKPMIIYQVLGVSLLLSTFSYLCLDTGCYYEILHFTSSS